MKIWVNSMKSASECRGAKVVGVVKVFRNFHNSETELGANARHFLTKNAYKGQRRSLFYVSEIVFFILQIICDVGIS